MTSWNKQLYSFYQSLKPPHHLPNDILWLYPQRDKQVMEVVKLFLNKFYNDKNERTLLLGINPGRFGAGITGVNFTAAKQLTEQCGIIHPFAKGSEISAEFIYAMIEKFGGVNEFYSRFFIGSVCPLGFIKKGKNINYYDDKELLKIVEPFIVENINKLLQCNFQRRKCFAIGGEKNFKYLTQLNTKHHWFKEIIPLPHPRFIMQYKRKKLNDYINLYLQLLKN